MVQIQVAGLAVDVSNNQPVVIMKEVNGKRVMPIWIGAAEATAIALKLDNIVTQRPLTHDLLKIIIEGLDGKVKKVVVCELRDNTFYAKIFIERDGSMICIDARPSDSIALALRAQAAIFAHESLFNMELDLSQFKISMENESSNSLSDYLSKLDPEDLGRIDPDKD